MKAVDNPTRIIIESFPATSNNWIDILSALLVPVLAVVGIFIAYQQYKINEQRLRHETYERRLAIYKSVQKYLSEIMRDGKTTYDRALEFYSESSEATFLFDISVQDKIDTIYEKSIDMAYQHNLMYPDDGSPGIPVGHKRNEVVQKNSELLKWHTNELKNCRPFFAIKLGLKVR
ncbi:MAG: hypothetical protein JKX76_14925 [Colwellia sp.]|nr:hypothetical protein [Colwellia sp.]